MNTAELADLLEALAAVLRSQPKEPVNEFARRKKNPRVNSAVSTEKTQILESDKVNKKDLVAFIAQHKIPIAVGPKDSKELLKRRLMRFYEKTQSSPDSSAIRNRDKNQATSPELMKAFSFLLGKNNAKKQR